MPGVDRRAVEPREGGEGVTRRTQDRRALSANVWFTGSTSEAGLTCTAPVIRHHPHNWRGVIGDPAQSRPGPLSRTTPPTPRSFNPSRGPRAFGAVRLGRGSCGGGALSTSRFTPITRCAPRAEALAPTLLYKQRPPIGCSPRPGRTLPANGGREDQARDARAPQFRPGTNDQAA